MRDKKLLANFASLLISNFSVQGLRFITVILLTRKLGPELFGVYNYLLMLVGLCAILVEFGLKNYGIREFALGFGSWSLIGKIFKIRVLIAVLSTLAVVLLTLQAFRSTGYIQTSLIFSASLFIDAFLIDFVAISQEKLHLQALGQMMQAGVYLLGIYLLLQNSVELSAIAAVFSISHIFWIGIYFFGIDSIKAKENGRIRSKHVMMGAFPFLVAMILGTLQSQMDIFLLGQFHFSSILGDYSACLKLVSIPLGMVNSLMSSLQPRLARYSDNREESIKILKQYIKPLFLFIALMNLTFFVFGENIIHLFFGDKYHEAAVYLSPLGLVTSAFILTLLPMHALFVSKKTKKLLQISVTNFILSFVVISLTLIWATPRELPWAMLIVQCFCGYQAWRAHFKR